MHKLDQDMMCRMDFKPLWYYLDAGIPTHQTQLEA